jgi:hypothetical protein
MKINIFPFSNCSPNNPRISFGDSFYADPDRLSEKKSDEGGSFCIIRVEFAQVYD